MGEIVAWVAHGFRQRGADLSPRGAAVLLALVLLIGILGGVRLVLVSRVVVAARHLQEVREEISQLQQENAELEVMIIQEQSINSLLGEARGMGLEPATQVEFVRP